MMMINSCPYLNTMVCVMGFETGLSHNNNNDYDNDDDQQLPLSKHYGLCYGICDRLISTLSSMCQRASDLLIIGQSVKKKKKIFQVSP